MKKYAIISFVVLVAIGIFIILTNYYLPLTNKTAVDTFNIGNYDQCVNDYIYIFPNDVEKIKKNCELEKLIIEKPEEFKNYLNAGYEWKNFGERNPTLNRVFFDRSIAVYTMANEKFPAKYLTSWNLAHLYKSLGDKDNALKYFQMAIANNDLDPEPYLAIAEFYRYDLNKDSNFMISFYEKAIKDAAFGPESLMDNYAKYLYDIKDYDRALIWLEKLETKFPGQYAEMIKEVEAQQIN